ncbi:HTH_Tnp_Tc3_2 domain-containing protein [Trichonephila clavipes]|nr:HTH_Tnp_Tc3_2 domain-containing protein [Trichonephila clavipes]
MPSTDQSSRRPPHIVRNARVQQTASSAAIQAHVTPSLRTVFSRTIRRRLAEGYLGSRRPLRVLPLMPTLRCLPFGVVLRTKGTLDCRGMELGRF